MISCECEYGRKKSTWLVAHLDWKMAARLAAKMAARLAVY
jgi:hypothetical protein